MRSTYAVTLGGTPPSGFQWIVAGWLLGAVVAVCGLPSLSHTTSRAVTSKPFTSLATPLSTPPRPLAVPPLALPAHRATPMPSGAGRGPAQVRAAAARPLPAALLMVVAGMAGVASLAWGRLASRPAAPWAVASSALEDNDPTIVLVGNLPPSATYRSLSSHFAVCGDVVFSTIEQVRGEKGPERRGLVQFSSWEGAARAIQIMKDHPMEGVVLTVEPDLRPADPARTTAPAFTRDRPAATARADRNTPRPYRYDPRGSRQEEAKVKAAQDQVDRWQALRGERNYDEADKLRELLKREGVVVVDERSGKSGRTWFFQALLPEGPSNSIAVTNLPLDATVESLSHHFAPAGFVRSATIYTDETTGQPTGKGVVRFQDPETAQRALEILQGQPMGGQVLTLRSRSQAAPRVTSAWTRDPRDPSATGDEADLKRAAEITAALAEREKHRMARDYARADAVQIRLAAEGVTTNTVRRTWSTGTTPQVPPEEARVLFVRGLPPNASRTDVQAHFGLAGTVESVWLPTDRTTKQPTGTAVVQFSAPVEAQKALAALAALPFEGEKLRIQLSTRPPRDPPGPPRQ